MKKLTVEFEFDGYDFMARGFLSDSGHVHSSTITPIGFAFSDLDKSTVQEVYNFSQEKLVEKFFTPEVE